MFYVILYGLPKISNVHLLYSFIHVFIYNSITKCFWQNFAKPLAKAFKTPLDYNFQWSDEGGWPRVDWQSWQRRLTEGWLTEQASGSWSRWRRRIKDLSKEMKLGKYSFLFGMIRKIYQLTIIYFRVVLGFSVFIFWITLILRNQKNKTGPMKTDNNSMKVTNGCCIWIELI